jgi:hypothetical protein
MKKYFKLISPYLIVILLIGQGLFYRHYDVSFVQLIQNGAFVIIVLFIIVLLICLYFLKNKLIRVLDILLSVFVVLIFLYQLNISTCVYRVIILVPKNYDGNICVFYDIEDGVKPRIEGNSVISFLPDNGVLFSSFISSKLPYIEPLLLEKEPISVLNSRATQGVFGSNFLDSVYCDVPQKYLKYYSATIFNKPTAEIEDSIYNQKFLESVKEKKRLVEFVKNSINEGKVNIY